MLLFNNNFITNSTLGWSKYWDWRYLQRVFCDNQYENEQRDAEDEHDEYDEELDDLEQDEKDENLDDSAGRSRLRRQKERVDYALLHSTGRRRKKK